MDPSTNIGNFLFYAKTGKTVFRVNKGLKFRFHFPIIVEICRNDRREAQLQHARNTTGGVVKFLCALETRLNEHLTRACAPGTYSFAIYRPLREGRRWNFSILKAQSFAPKDCYYFRRWIYLTESPRQRNNYRITRRGENEIVISLRRSPIVFRGSGSVYSAHCFVRKDGKIIFEREREIVSCGWNVNIVSNFNQCNLS